MAAAVCDLPARVCHRMINFTRCAAEHTDQAGPKPDWRAGEAWSHELDETDLEPPNNVGDVEFTDSAERALKGRSLHRTWGGSRTCTRGRHGVPSESTRACPESTAWPTGLLSTQNPLMTSRRGVGPNVAPNPERFSAGGRRGLPATLGATARCRPDQVPPTRNRQTAA
jgi:hypothetical protein